MISNIKKYPTIFSIHNIESIPKHKYKFHGSSLALKKYYLEKIVIHSKENKEVTLNIESQSKVFLGYLSYEEISKAEIKLQVNFFTLYLSNNFTRDCNGHMTRDLRIQGNKCDISCDMITPELQVLGSTQNGYNLVIDIKESKIEKFEVKVKIEPIEINLDKEKNKAKGYHTESFSSLCNREEHQKEQYR